ncbi:hypothetical protein EVA_19974 [gut metagenome]|uniref:Uncharacterized protein n=1 Tax=gut metagenome TaxID=749906 RepID=J9FX20_9ZZZZ
MRSRTVFSVARIKAELLSVYSYCSKSITPTTPLRMAPLLIVRSTYIKLWGKQRKIGKVQYSDIVLCIRSIFC